MKSIFVATVLLCVQSTFLRAAEAPVAPKPIEIEALISEILQHNPELAFYAAEIDAAKGERRAATSLANPEVSTQVGRKTVRGGGLSDEGMAWSVSVQQAFEWPGRIPLRKAIANRHIALAELGRRQFEASLKARARTFAYTLFAAEQKAAVAREVADRFHDLREVLVQRDPAGLTPTLELRIIEATVLTAQRAATQASLEVQAALLALNQLRGAAIDAPIQVTAGELAFPPAPDAATLFAAARTNNFELLMRTAELELQGFKVSLARNERYPSVSVGPYFSQERARETESIVGLGVSIPVPLWNRNKGNVEVAKAREQQAQTSLFVTQRELERKVAEQRLRYETKLAEMAKWRPDAIAQFREAAALADRHYRLGAVPITTYVELQKQYLEAVEALLDTKKETLEASEEIQALTGMNLRDHTAHADQPSLP